MTDYSRMTDAALLRAFERKERAQARLDQIENLTPAQQDCYDAYDQDMGRIEDVQVSRFQAD